LDDDPYGSTQEESDSRHQKKADKARRRRKRAKRAMGPNSSESSNEVSKPRGQDYSISISIGPRPIVM